MATTANDMIKINDARILLAHDGENLVQSVHEALSSLKPDSVLKIKIKLNGVARNLIITPVLDEVDPGTPEEFEDQLISFSPDAWGHLSEAEHVIKCHDPDDEEELEHQGLDFDKEDDEIDIAAAFPMSVVSILDANTGYKELLCDLLTSNGNDKLLGSVRRPIVPTDLQIKSFHVECLDIEDFDLDFDILYVENDYRIVFSYSDEYGQNTPAVMRSILNGLFNYADKTVLTELSASMIPLAYVYKDISSKKETVLNLMSSVGPFFKQFPNILLSYLATVYSNATQSEVNTLESIPYNAYQLGSIAQLINTDEYNLFFRMKLTSLPFVGLDLEQSFSHLVIITNGMVSRSNMIDLRRVMGDFEKDIPIKDRVYTKGTEVSIPRYIHDAVLLLEQYSKLRMKYRIIPKTDSVVAHYLSSIARPPIALGDFEDDEEG